jgi:hypothetical protein
MHFIAFSFLFAGSTSIDCIICSQLKMHYIA